MRRIANAAAALALASVIAACGGANESGSSGVLDGELEYLFGQIGSIGVGRDGTIYVLDRQAPDLRAYDAQGTYLMTLGEKGEGPR